MRRALLPLLPAFAAIYGLKPADIDNMPLRELRVFQADLYKRVTTQ